MTNEEILQSLEAFGEKLSSGILAGMTYYSVLSKIEKDSQIPFISVLDRRNFLTKILAIKPGINGHWKLANMSVVVPGEFGNIQTPFNTTLPVKVENLELVFDVFEGLVEFGFALNTASSSQNIRSELESLFNK